jgi:hypothetical protein
MSQPRKATCSTCVFFEPPDHEDGKGSCRRFPPSLAIAHEQIFENLRDSGHGIEWRCVARWPEVELTDWCGEHRAATA